MADSLSDNNLRTGAHQDPLAQYLLLLTFPLITPESVQEVLDINASSTTPASRLPVVNDASIIEKHFSRSGEAVILNKDQAERIVEYASRHRAIYEASIAFLDDLQFSEATVNAFGLEYPLWLFVPEGGITLLPDGLAGSTSRSASALGWATRQSGPEVTASKVIAESDESTSRSKLRPAQAVLDRLRHDESLNEDDYCIVYEDRFEGEISLDITQWAADTSEEEFIPQHRILRFERKWDGVCVWDRKNRIDLLSASSQKEQQRLSGRAVSIDSFHRLTNMIEMYNENTKSSVGPDKIQFEFAESKMSTKGIVLY